MAQLDDLKIVLGIADDTEDVILTYELNRAAKFIARRRATYNATTGDAEVETALLDVQVQLAAESYSKRGAEGEEGHSESGVKRSYSNGGPYSLETMNMVIPKVKVVEYVTDDEA